MADTKQAIERRLTLNRRLMDLCEPHWEAHREDVDARDFVFSEEVPPEKRAQIAAVLIMLWREDVSDEVARAFEELEHEGDDG